MIEVEQRIEAANGIDLSVARANYAERLICSRKAREFQNSEWRWNKGNQTFLKGHLLHFDGHSANVDHKTVGL